MMLLRLDYQDKTRAIPWAGIVLLAASVAVAVEVGVYYRELTGQIAYWKAKARQAEGASEKSLRERSSDSRDVTLEIGHANEVLNKITLPWDKLFEAVEWSSGKEVALLGMEPNAEKLDVKIIGEAKNIKAALGYIQHLASQEIFSSVYLQSHQIQQQNPDKPVRFTVLAIWKAAP